MLLDKQKALPKKDLNELAVEASCVSPQKRSAAMRIPKRKKKSDRGFGYIRWRDQYWQECRFSESSLATKECIWLGENDYCMHLDRKQAGDLAVLLEHFADTGFLP